MAVGAVERFMALIPGHALGAEVVGDERVGIQPALGIVAFDLLRGMAGQIEPVPIRGSKRVAGAQCQQR